MKVGLNHDTHWLLFTRVITEDITKFLIGTKQKVEFDRPGERSPE